MTSPDAGIQLRDGASLACARFESRHQVGLVVGTIGGLIAFSNKHEADPSAGYRAADISTVAFISAGVAIAVGATLLIIAPSPNATKDLTARSPATHRRARTRHRPRAVGVMRWRRARRELCP
jgi:hypothetical protein